MQIHRAFAAATAVAALAIPVGCGGGGAGPKTPLQAVAERTVPASSGAPRGTPVFVPTETNGPSAYRVADYLRIQASGLPPGLVRYASPPSVRLARGVTDRERAITLYAVALINRALPYDQHLEIGPDVPRGRAHQWRRGLPHVPDGQLFVEWHRLSAAGRASPAVAHQSVTTTYDAKQKRWERKHLRASSVEMDSDNFDKAADWVAVSVLVHELLHSIGLQQHVPCGTYADSNMCDSWFQLNGALPAIDAAALQALYTRLDEETEPEELDMTSLGPWSSRLRNLSGSLCRDTTSLAYGVRHGNGVSAPWTSGRDPLTALKDNRALTGSVTWNGELLGFTPAFRSVRGDAGISVNLATMRGTAAFTGLRSWNAGLEPGAPGTGVRWGDGDLRYTVAVAENFLLGTGGDDGTLIGRFVGTGHQGVVGSVERADLTAAFGAIR